MKTLRLFLFILCSASLNAQSVQDNFEGSGTITSWAGDDCEIDTNFSNPYQLAINTSSTVLEYDDIGGLYANVRFDVSTNFDLTTKNGFSFKIYVPSSSITGSQENKVSLKLQDGTLGSPWLTQSEIIKSIDLDVWQEVTFNFESDAYNNLDTSSPPPIERTDFNRVVIQINGENNSDNVVAYIDDFLHLDLIPNETVYVYDELVWSDEFDTNGAVDSNNWFHQTQLPAGGSWFNGEEQHYTNRIVNSFVEDGFLNIVAIKESFPDQGQTKQYTSARLNSKFAFTYGRVDVKAKLPFGEGTWPAIWTLGKNVNEDGAYWDNQGFGTTTWPACGEIDIMEHGLGATNHVSSALHTPCAGCSGNTMNTNSIEINDVANNFHIYSVNWSPDQITFLIDDVEFYTYNPTVKDNLTWPFYQNQYLLLNIAMGGVAGTIDPNFNQSSMIIDYVRVYQESGLSVSQYEENKEVRIYPNPVTNDLTISLNQPITQNVELLVFDVSGRVVSSKEYNTQEQSISYNTSHLTAGLYFMTLAFKDGSMHTVKVIKK
jgi:beta-glucanase (GH16 family)